MKPTSKGRGARQSRTCRLQDRLKNWDRAGSGSRRQTAHATVLGLPLTHNPLRSSRNRPTEGNLFAVLFGPPHSVLQKKGVVVSRWTRSFANVGRHLPAFVTAHVAVNSVAIVLHGARVVQLLTQATELNVRSVAGKNRRVLYRPLFSVTTVISPSTALTAPCPTPARSAMSVAVKAPPSASQIGKTDRPICTLLQSQVGQPTRHQSLS